MSKAPNDRKNIERQAKLRYAIQSGQSSIHGDTNYEIQTQEAQSFDSMLAQVKVLLREVGLELEKQFYIRLDLIQKFSVKD